MTIFNLCSTGSARVSKKAPATTMNDKPMAPLPTIPIIFSFFILGPSSPLKRKPSRGKRIVRYIKSIIVWRLPLENIYFVNINC